MSAEAGSHRRKHGGRWLGLGIAALLALVVVVVGVKVVRALALARELKSTGESLKQAVLAVDGGGSVQDTLAQAPNDLASARRLTASLRATLWPFGGLLRALGGVPNLGSSLAAVPPLLDSLDALLSSADHLQTAFAPAMEAAAAPTAYSSEALQALARSLSTGGDEIAAARADLARAQAARAQIAAQGLVPQLQAPLHDLDTALEGLNTAFVALDVLPTLLGVDGPQHVLVLVENADEMRPTGGFITSTAYVVLDQGQINEVTVLHSSSPEIDRFVEQRYGPPPTPLRDLMQLSIWAFRDTNWSPDFPTSATQAIDLYTQARGVPVDTVVAINQYFVADLLAAIGDVYLPDGTQITADNVQVMLRQAHTRYLEERGQDARKDFINELVPQIVDKVLAVHSPGQAAALWDVANQAAAGGDLLIYSTNPTIQRVSERLGWDGSLPIAPGDYVYVVDSNVGYNKADASIERQMAYHITLADLSAPYAVLDLQYHNLSHEPTDVCRNSWATEDYAQLVDDCYGDYLRVYLPQGAQMLSAPLFGIPDSYAWTVPGAGQVGLVGGERQKDVYAGLMVVPRNTTVSARYIYRLPPEAILTRRADGTLVYRLTVQKEPGIPQRPAAITIDLPSGSQLVGVSPEPTYRDAQSIYYETDMSQNFVVELALLPPTDDAALLNGLPLEATPASEPTPRFLPTATPAPTIVFSTPVTMAVTATPSPTPTLLTLPAALLYRANLRTEPFAGAPLVGTFEAGEILQVGGRNDAGDWLLAMTSNGALGWVAANLVDLGGRSANALPVMAVSAPTPSPTPPIVATLSARTNLRRGPDTSAEVLDVLEAGAAVTVVGRDISGLWLLVKAADERQGWMFTSLVDGARQHITGIPIIYPNPLAATPAAP